MKSAKLRGLESLHSLPIAVRASGFCICEIGTRVDHFRYSGIKCDDLCEVISAMLTQGDA